MQSHSGLRDQVYEYAAYGARNKTSKCIRKLLDIHSKYFVFKSTFACILEYIAV